MTEDRNTEAMGTFSISYKIRHVGFCKYCGEGITSKESDYTLPDIPCHYRLKLKDGTILVWHLDCYNEALAKVLMEQRK